jgi:Fe-S oxidoreductase
MKGEFPAEAQTTLRNIENNGNPWGIGFDERANWAKDLEVPTLADKPEVDVLYWVGCAGSFDDRNKKVSTAVVKILKEAGIDFAILGAFPPRLASPWWPVPRARRRPPRRYNSSPPWAPASLSATRWPASSVTRTQ